MTIEEKAKAYDEAIKIAKEELKEADAIEYNLPDSAHAIRTTVYSLFPELKESNDELIRKEILSFCRDRAAKYSNDPKYVNIEKWIAWLEKKGEQKHADNIEPKFKVGDVIRLKGSAAEYTIKKVTDTTYYTNAFSCGIERCEEDYELVEQKSNNEVEQKFKVGNWYQCTKDFFGKGVRFDKGVSYYCAKDGCLQNEYGCHIAIVNDLYDNFKLWTIQDAKDGDQWHKQQMMKEAMDVIIDSSRSDGKTILSGNFFKYNTGDKVKIIIVKED